MTKDQEELLRLLDIGESSTDDELEILEFDFEDEDLEGELSETVLIQDEWDKSKGKELSQLHSLGNELAVADFHSAAYHIDPEFAGTCISKRRQEFMHTLMESPDFQQMRQSTCQNLLASEMATVQVAREFASLQEKDKQDPPKASLDGQPDGNLLASTAKALAAAQQEVDAVDEMEKALGQAAGLGQGDAAQSANLDKIRSAFQRLKNSRRLKDIFDKAGSYRRAAKAIQNSKTKHGYDDMVGVEMAGDVDRLVTDELAFLGDEDLEMETLRRIVENQAMCLEYEGVEQLAKGPVVVVVDESGSMSGDRIANAKALALSLAWIAKHQKRWCALVGFSGGTEGVLCVLKPGKWNETELMNWLDHFYAGGTTLDVPLDVLPNKYWQQMQAPKGKTDIIIITDALVHAPEKMVTDFNSWKTKEEARCISIILGAQPGDLAKVSNEVHCIPSLSVNCDAAISCMSI